MQTDSLIIIIIKTAEMISKQTQLTENQIDDFAQIELDRLQKVFRLMESDKEAYSDDVSWNRNENPEELAFK